ncbi:MAG: V-type ATP synthase subunit I [Treponema sp.]
MRKDGKMKLLELVILKDDVNTAMEYLGKSGAFQMYKRSSEEVQATNPYKDIFDHLRVSASYLGLHTDSLSLDDVSFPSKEDIDEANKIINEVDAMQHSQAELNMLLEKAEAAYNEANAFSRLKLPYNEVDALTFLTIRIGKIPPSSLESLNFSVGNRALIIPLNEDGSKIIAASSKKGRFALDTELKKVDFVPMEIPKDFKGMPNDILEALTNNIKEQREKIDELKEKSKTYVSFNEKTIVNLLKKMSLGYQIVHARFNLDEAQEVYRLRGWVASSDVETMAKDLTSITDGRIALQTYETDEVPDVKNGIEKVPVSYKHNRVIKSFERMVFSYGVPLYGNIDPTPIVAVLFTLLFGIMFGDLGQGMVIFSVGIFLYFSKTQLIKDWKKFSFIFMGMGMSSMIMGLLTGEFFTNHTLLIPFSRTVTGFFGKPEDHILHLMPESGAILKLMYFFGFTMFIGFIINSLGIIINIINNIKLRRIERVLLGKTGLVGLSFFWYVAFMVLRIIFIKNQVYMFDSIFIAITILLIFLGEPLERIITKESPIFENGIFAGFIQGFVEILELLSTFISNSVSFLRVGAFALSHAVLSFIVFKLTDLVGGYFSMGLLVSIIGNAIIILLESLIVSIQVIRLQYYEFFSKFFTETGVEFKPFKFEYKSL